MPGSRPKIINLLVAGLVLFLPAHVIAGSQLCPQFMPDCKLDLFVRYRYEDVNDHSVSGEKLNGDANTFRLAAGLDTGTFKGVGLFGQVEQVASMGRNYSDGGVNGVSDLQRAQILDAEGFEIKQSNIRFDGREYINQPIINATLLRAGRQEIKHRNDPFQRFLGNVGFRQHFQTYDAVRLTNRSLRDTIFDYSYLWNVNTFFGDRNNLKGNRALDGHAFNVLFDGNLLRDSGGRQWGKFETFGYLLDFKGINDAQFSSQTYGARLDTRFPGLLGITRSETTASLEYAHQWNYGNNPQSFDHGYFHSELGFNYFPSMENLVRIDSMGLLFGYELLAGDGRRTPCTEPCKPPHDQASAFQTPLGTNHAFLGAVDRFAGQTPPDGVHDRYVSIRSQFAPWNTVFTLQTAYHDFVSDQNRYRYGGEWVVTAEWSPFSDNSAIGEKLDNNCNSLHSDRIDKCQLIRTVFSRNLLVGIQYANYQADKNNDNNKNSYLKLNQDVDKLWAYVQWKLDY